MLESFDVNFFTEDFLSLCLGRDTGSICMHMYLRVH